MSIARRCLFSLARALAASVVLLVLSSPTPTCADPTIGAQNPAPINSIEIEGGQLIDFQPSQKDRGYYRVSYKGSLLRSYGTPFHLAAHLDSVALLSVQTEGKGDQTGLSLRLEGSEGVVGGGLFEALGIKPFSLSALNRLELRGTGYIGSDKDFRVFQAAGGLETPPIRLPGFARTQWTNWLTFGVSGQRSDNVDEAVSDANSGRLTYRAFVGKAFGWHRSGDVNVIAARLAADIRRLVPTYAGAKEVVVTLRKIPANKRSSIQQLVLDAAQDARSDADWEAEIQQIALGQTEAVQDQPTIALYAESSGWQIFAGSVEGPHFRQLSTVTVDVWPITERHDVLLRARYEWGYERADPKERKDHLLLSVAARL